MFTCAICLTRSIQKLSLRTRFTLAVSNLLVGIVKQPFERSHKILDILKYCVLFDSHFHTSIWLLIRVELFSSINLLRYISAWSSGSICNCSEANCNALSINETRTDVLKNIFAFKLFIWRSYILGRTIF